MQRAQRLCAPREFRRVREHGRTWAHPLLILGAVPNRLGRTRCGFVVGRTHGIAVRRNRLKRRVREAVRLVFEQIAPGWDLVFIVRAGVATAPWSELRHAVQGLLTQAGLWRSAHNDQPHSPKD